MAAGAIADWWRSDLGADLRRARHGTNAAGGVFQRDYPVVTGVFLIVGVSILLINLMVDLTYGFLDPKVRH